MKYSLAYRGSILWNLVNYNDKTSNVSFKELKRRLILKTLSLTAQQSLRRDTDSANMCTFKRITVRF